MSGWSVTTGAEDANKTNKHREFQIQFEMEDFVHQAVILVVSSTYPPPPAPSLFPCQIRLGSISDIDSLCVSDFAPARARDEVVGGWP
jgi:hypothetical protein